MIGAGRHNQTQPRPVISLRRFINHLPHTFFVNKTDYNTSSVVSVVLKNAEHACCIVSLFHFHQARSVLLRYNGVKTSISPWVLRRAENIVNNPLFFLREKRRSRLKRRYRCLARARHDVGFLVGSLRGQRQRRTDTGVRCPPVGGPACARCQEASSGTDHLFFLKKEHSPGMISLFSPFPPTTGS